jgi:hypothetical protein
MLGVTAWTCEPPGACIQQQRQRARGVHRLSAMYVKKSEASCPSDSPCRLDHHHRSVAYTQVPAMDPNKDDLGILFLHGLLSDQKG